jgi:hypothetical protein
MPPACNPARRVLPRSVCELCFRSQLLSQSFALAWWCVCTLPMTAPFRDAIGADRRQARNVKTPNLLQWRIP